MLSDASHLVKDRSRSRSLRRSGTRSEGGVCRGTAYADQHAAFDVTAISQTINRATHTVDSACKSAADVMHLTGTNFVDNTNLR
jgi:hypothetical protein